ncbi:right-handed parallel beta-helix repeat-containing protein [Faecalibacterium prausnitzii]|uniref:right-handed parallel beta-helix repeat-containing protein n=1 Tax=Faecalibacterium prausnitzii TaxID=853 RepID=UPI0012DDEA2A|nr:right-handed parallel beta-helix repeat-containing protein [Faecalibacterium prausnitzii]
MKKRWFVVILTIGLLLHVLPLSVLALSPDPTITDADGTILDWSDLSTVSDVLDDSQKQNSAVVDAKPGTAAPGLAETGPGKSLADADNDEEAADDRPTVNLTPKIPDEESGGDNLADADRDEAAADDRPTVNLTPKIPDEESDDDGSADDTGSTTAPAVCKIDKIDDTYYYSTLDDAITAATDGDQIDLLANIELYEGLTFDNKTLTISGGGTRTLTLNQNGMYASHSDITFKDLTLNIYAHTHTHEGGAGGTANLISNSNLRLNNVNFTLIPDGSCGSGIYLYQKSNLYLDGSYAVIRGVSNYRASGIYADDSEFKGQPNREIKINNSYLEITGCAHAAMTIDPIDITLSSSNVVVMDNGKSDPDGYGFGIGCYGGKLTMESSTLTATGNTGAWYGYAVFVDGLDVDSGSTLDIRDNGGSGLGVGGIGVIQGGSQVICDGNGTNDPGYGSGGLYVYAGADLTIESGANVSVCQNKGLAAIVNSCKLHIQNGANVSVDNNAKLGIYNSYDSYLTIESGANVTANHNGAHGIYNQVMGDLKQGAFLIESGANVTANYNTVSGIVNCNLFTVEKGANLQVEYNSNCGIQNDEHATLNLLAGSVRYNHAGSVGGGLVNSGTAILSDDVELYNNHARLSGDDIYNADGATITFGPTGRGWELDGDPDCYDFITGWYDDYETTRWNAHGDEADLHMVLVAPVASYTGPLSLKAAHGSIGSLTVCKETVGELLPSDYDTVFTFELTLDDDAITTINDKWCGVPFKNGKASFTLKSGESITLSNLPAGIGYTITETAQDGWTLLNLNPAETGVVPQNDTAKVVFTNLKNSPDDPDVPVVPVDPEEPEIPEEPEGPETPEEPEEPEIPEETEETEAPGELPAEEPAQTDTSASLAQPEETPTQNTTTVTLIQTGTTDWLAAVLLISGIGLLACGWFFDRKQRAAKH